MHRLSAFPANVQSQGLEIIRVPFTVCLFFFSLKKSLYIYEGGFVCVYAYAFNCIFGEVNNKSKADFIYNPSGSMWKAGSSER